jgi:hypothetical protein
MRDNIETTLKYCGHIYTSLNLKFTSESELLYDWRFTANHFVLATSPLRPETNIFF